MADNNKSPFSFKPIILDQETYSKRRVIRQLPSVHQTETLQKFFASSVDHLFDAGKAKQINGYVGQRPLWLNPDQDYYLTEPNTERQFYQLEPSMVSRATDTSITNLLFYTDLVDHVRFQGGIVDNHSRLFEQEYYSWCPPIDLDKNINFRQYYWLEKGPPAINIWGPKTQVVIGDGETTEFALPEGEGVLYRYSDINPITHIRVLVDGRPYLYSDAPNVDDTYTYDASSHEVTIHPVPAVDAEVVVWIYSDVSTHVVGKDMSDPTVKAAVITALGGIVPSAGMKVRLRNDINPAFNGKTFIFENTGGELVLLDDDSAFDPDSLVDNREYVTIARGSKDGNPWSTRNRWFHRDVVDSTLMEDTERLTITDMQEAQASRPIIEYKRDLELFNYGRFRRGDVHIKLNGLTNNPSITDLVGYVAANTSELKFDDLVLKNGIGSSVEIDGRLYDNVRILATNTDQALINNRIYAITSQVGTPMASSASSDWRVASLTATTAVSTYDASYIETNSEGRQVITSKPGEAQSFVSVKTVVPKSGKKYRSTFVMRKIAEPNTDQVSFLQPSFDGIKADGSMVQMLGTISGTGYIASKGLVDTTCWELNKWYEIAVEWSAGPTNQYKELRARVRINRSHPDDITTDPDIEFSNAQYELRSQKTSDITSGGTPKLVIALESDGQDPSGTPKNGEITSVLLGNSAGMTFFYDGVEWIQGQQKGFTGPLFNLYDMNGNGLADPGLYPRSTFAGSRLFSYDIDETSSRPVDPVLGFRISHDNKGQIKFKNYTTTERFTYRAANDDQEIIGLYFHKTFGNVEETDQLSNDWYKASANSRQMIVDQYVVTEGRSKIFDISQEPAEQVIGEPANLTVELGRINDSGDFVKALLRENEEFFRQGKRILIKDIRKDDVIEIRSFNPKTPTNPIGQYEVPQNLQANPLSGEVGTVTKGDLFDHFADIIRSQAGFSGAEYAVNNWRDTAQERNRGLKIVQNSASLLKTMLLSSEEQLDIMQAARYVEAEYSRFRSKFEQKISEFWNPETNTQTQLDFNATIDTWINTALTEINRGKTKEFPFYWSGMGQTAIQPNPTFIPASPSFLGLYPLYVPQIVVDSTNDVGNRYILGHDGSMTLCFQNSVEELDPRDQVILALEQRIYSSVPDNIRNRERPLFDTQTVYGDRFRKGDYSYAEYLQILRPMFERWHSTHGLDYHNNDLKAIYDEYQDLVNQKAEGLLVDEVRLAALGEELNNPWNWNWSSVTDESGYTLPGYWRGIYTYYFGTDRPHSHPWEMLGFVEKPIWWDSRYGDGPYTSDNHILWDDLEFGYIHAGPRKGDTSWARPGLTGRYDDQGNLLTTPVQGFVPVDQVGELRHPGPVSEGGCGIAAVMPLLENAVKEWQWGDRSPIESVWFRSSLFPYASAQAGYLMKPARFVELGWDSANIVTLFEGEPQEQQINELTQTRAVNAALQVHGEINEDYSVVVRYGVQQWISDHLASRNRNIKESLGDKVRGLSAQLAYKMAGFTDIENLFVVSDSFDRVPREDVTAQLYRSPSTKEEFYGGVIVEKMNAGWRVFGYDVLKPFFNVIYGDPNGDVLAVGENLSSQPTPEWRPGVNYSVNIVVKREDHYYRAVRTHTSLSTFEESYWMEISRPQYADGSTLLWALEANPAQEVSRVSYGQVFNTPQEVANFLNGYQRYLVSRGFVFDRVDREGMSMADWREALLNFITWSQGSVEEGNFIALSPSNQQVKYVTDQGTIQPVERIINGVYALIDRSGNPIQPNKTTVVRTDGEVTVSPDTSVVGGIYGMRLYVSDVEHVIILNNTTIFNDTVYNPLLNVRQARLRLQGFKTRGWKGRIDAPGFIVTGNTLIPNFEKAADDFRQFFAIESVDTSELQARARANLGYEEREYLNNLLLTPTNQFELYQGMIQQKGTSSVMSRLLRSNFIRHNKGLKFFEEWAFRIGDYGGSEVKPIMVINLAQKDIKNNPQLIEFNSLQDEPLQTETDETKVIVNDLFDGEKLVHRDDRWVWRPDMQYVNWPAFRENSYEKGYLPRAGYVNVDEASFFLKNESDLSTLLDITFDAAANVDKRIWVYGFDTGEWATYRFAKTDQNILSITPSTVANQAAIVALDSALVDNTILPKRDRDLNYITGNLEVVNNRIILREFAETTDTVLGEIYRPAVSNEITLDITPLSDDITPFMEAVSQAGLMIDDFEVEVIEAFSDGAALAIGTEDEGLNELFLRFPVVDSELEPDYTTRVNRPTEVYVVPKDYEIGQQAPTVEVEIVRVGEFNTDPCNPTFVKVSYKILYSTPETDSILLEFNPAHKAVGDTYLRQTVSIPVDVAIDTVDIEVTAELANALGDPMPEEDKLDAYQHIVDTATVSVIRPAAGGSVVLDLTKKGAKINTKLEMPSAYPYNMLTQRIDDIIDLTGVSEVDATEIANQPTRLIATLQKVGTEFGRVRITVRYHYTKGFELFSNEAIPQPVGADNVATNGKAYGLVPTRFKDEDETLDMIGLANGIVEIDNFDEKGWAVKNCTTGQIVRHQNSRVQSKQINGAAIYNNATNELQQTLQLFDPVKGFIPGVADRELAYKLDYDPAIYNRSNDETANVSENGIWGPEQVGRLWWDLSTTRYLDYEINDTVSGGIDYRWKHWGKLAPGIEIDIYEWVRSTSHPVDWAELVKKNADVSVLAASDKPTGIVKNATMPNWVERLEWNEELQRDETVYYYWVKDVATVPPVGGRELTAVQVSNIIQDPVANDIPYIAIIDTNKIVVGGTNQYLNDTDTILRVTWHLTDGDSQTYDGLHHKQWAILREGDERNTINATMWNKMRDSLVGWDGNADISPAEATLKVGFEEIDVSNAGFKIELDSQDIMKFMSNGRVIIKTENQGDVWVSYSWIDYEKSELHGIAIDNVLTFTQIEANVKVIQDRHIDDPKSVPDPMLSETESMGNMIRPRQSWFPSEWVSVGQMTKRPSRYARQLFVESFNNILSRQPFADQWYDWQEIFETGTELPSEQEYAFKVYDFTELEALPSLPNPIKPGQLALLESTAEARGFWTLWRWIVPADNSEGRFELERAQQFRMQEDELWELSDWYADGWSPADFPIYRFRTIQERNAAAPLDVTLMKGTLVQVDNQSDTDPRWSWSVYTDSGWNEVARQKATFRLKDNFFLDNHSEFKPQKGTSIADVKAVYNNAVLQRDGTWELKWLLDTIGERLFTKLQINELFFSMVKNALALNPDTDWVFKTSFLYLGGYAEELKQRPVAQKDQVDNVIAYLEEVKPYHVKIRDYVRRLSYGPDVARISVLDFDKSAFPKEWAENHQNPGYEISKWGTDWNPVRRFKTKIQVDRIACESTNGWDYPEVPWDSAQIRYRGQKVYDVIAILNEYRDATPLPGNVNLYKDATVKDLDARNRLVRDRKVVRGTIATVILPEATFWIWTGTVWMQIWATQWDGNWFNGAVDRIKEAYMPLPGMKQIGDDGLISGCDFRGTKQDGDYFEHGMFDQFAWDYQGQGYADQFEYFSGGRDVDLNTTVQGFKLEDLNGISVDDDETAIDIDGAEFNNLTDGSGHPEELARIKAKDPLTITVYEKGVTNTAFRMHKNGVNHWEQVRLDEDKVVAKEWNAEERKLTITTEDGAFPFHNPAQPSKEFLDTVRISRGYRATKSTYGFSDSGNMQLKLTEWNANKRLKQLPIDLMPKDGNEVEVVIEQPGNTDVRMVGKIIFSGDLETWLETKTLNVEITGYIGDATPPAGTFDDWNIIPMRAYNQLGVVWVGKERLTYATVEAVEGTNDFILGLVRRGTATTFAGDIEVDTPVYDGSILKWLPNSGADLRRVPGPQDYLNNKKAWEAFLAQSTGGPTRE